MGPTGGKLAARRWRHRGACQGTWRIKDLAPPPHPDSSNRLRGLPVIRLPRVLFRRAFALIVVQLLSTGAAQAQLVNRDWNTGNGAWNIAGNWTPTTSAPDNGTPVGVTYNVQIGNLGVAAGAQVTF